MILPEGWTATSTRDLFSFVTSGSRDWAKYYSATGALFLRITNLDHDSIALDLSDKKFVALPKSAEGMRTKVQAGDLLISITADVGMIGLVGNGWGEAYINQHIALARPCEKVCGPYLAWYLAANDGGQRQLRDLQRGATKVGLGLNDITSVCVPFPPEAEQKRIVAKLDILLARVRASQERLATVPAILKRFRQSVLAAACSGKLTTDWRTNHTFADVTSKSATPDTAPDVPSSWRWTRLKAIASIRGGVTKGRNLKGKSTVTLPYLRVANVQDGYLDLGEIKEIEVPPEDEAKYALLPGDILFTEGGDRDKLGRGTIWNGEIRRCIHQNHIFRARVIENGVLPAYVSLASKSDFSRQYFFDNANQTVNLASINLTTLSELPLAIPPTEEQAQIVRRVQELFAFADRLEARLKSARQQVDQLTQSILAKAFRGELVPTEAELAQAEGRTYESAEELLKHIRADRDQALSKRKDKSARSG